MANSELGKCKMYPMCLQSTGDSTCGCGERFQDLSVAAPETKLILTDYMCACGKEYHIVHNKVLDKYSLVEYGHEIKT